MSQDGNIFMHKYKKCLCFFEYIFFKTQKQTKNDAKKTKTKTKKNNEKMCIAYRD